MDNERKLRWVARNREKERLLTEDWIVFAETSYGTYVNDIMDMRNVIKQISNIKLDKVKTSKPDLQYSCFLYCKEEKLNAVLKYLKTTLRPGQYKLLEQPFDIKKLFESMKVFKFTEFITESLPQQKSVDQLKMVRKLSKGTDIGDKIHMTGANLSYDTNVIDTGIESYQDYMSHAYVDHNKRNGFDKKGGPHVNYTTPNPEPKGKQKLGKQKLKGYNFGE